MVKLQNVRDGVCLAALALLLFPFVAEAAAGFTGAQNMASARFGHTATLLPGGKVLVTGGTPSDSPIAPSKLGEIYDSVANTWATAAVMSSNRAFATGTLLANGKVLVVGGVSAPNTFLTSTEIYDPAGNSWTSGPPLVNARNSHLAVLLNNGKVLIIGGYTTSSVPNAELYDPVANTWSSASNMSISRVAFGAVLLASGKVFVSGGISSTNSAVSSAEIYDPGTNTWSAAGQMGSGRVLHTLTRMLNGKVLATGGYSNVTNFTIVNSAEVYDPASNTWTPAPNMAGQRESHSATLLASGKVLVAGSLAPTAELYDPTSNTWSSAGNLVLAGRFRHSATTLLDGRVLLAGGETSGPTNSAEIYDPGTPPPVITFNVSAPASTNAVSAFNFTVTARDQNNTVQPGYSGIAHFTSSDPAASLPANAVLNNGTGSFSATLNTAGIQTLTATDTGTASINGSATINVAAVTLAVAINGAPATVATGTQVALSSTVSGGAGGNYTYSWNASLNGTVVATGTQAAFSFTPSTEGNYLVSLSASDGHGNSGSASVSILADTVPAFLSGPAAVPSPGFADLTETFMAATNPADALLTWNFGDGTAAASGSGVQHIYAAAGTYTVSVSAQNPRSNTITPATFLLTIQDVFEGSSATLPGTQNLNLAKSALVLKSKKDKATLSATLPIAASQQIQNATLTLILNGLTETFTLNIKGQATTGDGSAKLSFKQKKGIVVAGTGKLKIALSGAALLPGVTAGVGLDSGGLPKKILAEIVFGGTTYSYLAPLKFKVSKSSSSAGFGSK